jgi:hypothetical protein
VNIFVASDATDVFNFLEFLKGIFMVGMTFLARNLTVLPFQRISSYAMIEISAWINLLERFLIVAGLTVLSKLILVNILMAASTVVSGYACELRKLFPISNGSFVALFAICLLVRTV